jgi:hypothetical protein
MDVDERKGKGRRMKKTAPRVRTILDALVAGKPITDEEVNIVLKDGKQSDLELAALMSPRTPYGPVLMKAAKGEEPECKHRFVEVRAGRVCVYCSMVG